MEVILFMNYNHKMYNASHDLDHLAESTRDREKDFVSLFSNSEFGTNTPKPESKFQLKIVHRRKNYVCYYCTHSD